MERASSEWYHRADDANEIPHRLHEQVEISPDHQGMIVELLLERHQMYMNCKLVIHLQSEISSPAEQDDGLVWYQVQSC